MSTSLRFCGAPVLNQQLALINDVVIRHGGLSRTELANTICELLDWVRPNGKLKTVECRQFLETLDEQALLQLPARHRAGRKKGTPQKIELSARSAINQALQGTVKEFAPITLRRVDSAADRALWREYVERYHYLGYRIAFGAQLCYFIEVAQPSAMIVGCIQLSSPAWRMAVRDRWIGWDDAVRARQLQRIVNNSRFVLFPFVKIKNLASHVLAKVSRCCVSDWSSTYHIRPLLLETLVDTRRFTGGCYRAANWLELGLTSGRGRHDSTHERHGRAPKTLFVYRLQRDALECLKQATPARART